MVDFPVSHVSFRGGNPKKSMGKMSALMPNQASHLRKNHISVFLFRRNGLFPELLRAHGRTLWAKGLGGGEHDFFWLNTNQAGVKVGPVDLVLISLIPSVSPPPPPPPPFYCVLLAVH